MSRETIFREVAAERQRQDEMFGGAEHDSTHSATDWVSILVRHLGLAVDDGSPAGVCLMNDHCAGADPVRYRRQMVRVAAIAVAALETFDRKAGCEEPHGQPATNGFIPRQGSARPAPDDGSTRLAEAAQRLADEHGEEVLLIPPGHPTLESGTRQIPYLTLSSVADEWEWQKATARVQPAKR